MSAPADRLRDSLHDLADAVEPAGDDEAEAAVQRLTLRRALLALTARQRAVIVLRFFEDHTEAEAAQMLGI